MPAPQTDSLGPPVARTAAEIRQWLLSQIAQSLKVDPSAIDPAAPLDSLGVESLTAMKITGTLAEWLHRDLPATLMWDYASLNAIADALAQRDTATDPPTWPGIIPLQPHGTLSPLFCFPGQGGHPVTFTPLASHLGPLQPCYGLTVPGLHGEEPPKNRLEDITAAMLQNIRRVQPQGPYQFAGYSFGGLLAYEAAQQLTARGETVSLLAIFDAFTPAGRKVRQRWLRFALHAYRLTKGPDRLHYFRTKLKTPPTDEETEESETTPDPNNPPVTPPLNHLDVSSTNAQAAAHYQPTPYPGSVLVFRPTDRAAKNIFYKMDPSCGWAALAKGGVRVIDLPGTHASLLDSSTAPATAEILRPYLQLNSSPS